MNWLYLITAFNQPRVQSRIMQILDKQAVRVEAFASVRMGDEIHISILGDSGVCDWTRLKALMHGVEEVLEIRVMQPEDAAGIGRKQFSIACERERQSFLVKALGALGVAIVCVSRSCVVFEAPVDEKEMARLHAICRRHWSIEELPAGSSAGQRAAGPGVDPEHAPHMVANDGPG